MQRPVKITQQEANGDEVKKNRQFADNPVFGDAMLPWSSRDGDFADAGPAPQSQHWNKPLQFTVNRKLRNQFALVCFKAATPVVDVDPGQLPQHPVGAPRREPLQPAFTAPCAAGASNVKAFL